MPPAKLVSTAKTYEELDGGQGREVFFRPDRHAAPDLLPLQARVKLRNGSDSYDCAVHDISQNGVAFEWPSGILLDGNFVGAELVDFEVSFDEHIAYRGGAKVGSIRKQEPLVIVGVSFVDFLLDVEDYFEVRKVKAWGSHPARSLSARHRPWHVEGQDRYKSLVAEYALYLADAESQMAELERTLPWHVLHGENDSAGRRSLISWVAGEFTQEVIRFTETIDAALRSTPAVHRPALQQFTRRYLDTFFMQAPWMQRARQKPFGYPGDYEIMRFFYERNFEGATLFAKAFHYATIQCRTAQAVVRRKDLIKEQLRNAITTQSAGQEPFRILSVAAGPAQELFDLLTELGELPRPLEIVMFDQDKGALSYAYRRLKPVVDRKWTGRVKLLYLHESIKRLLRDRQIFAEFGSFDAIFSCGLFDYLAPATASVLTRSLFARVGPSGRLYIGNMAPESPNRWVMELLLDWHLIHRTRPELLELAHAAVPEASVLLLEEETGVNPFVEMSRK